VRYDQDDMTDRLWVSTTFVHVLGRERAVRVYGRYKSDSPVEQSDYDIIMTPQSSECIAGASVGSAAALSASSSTEGVPVF
jgi:hypothetical protein